MNLCYEPEDQLITLDKKTGKISPSVPLRCYTVILYILCLDTYIRLYASYNRLCVVLMEWVNITLTLLFVLFDLYNDYIYYPMHSIFILC
jgi:hypothetical protein